MEAPGALFDEAHLQSLASSLGKRRAATEDGDDGYVKDPQCHETLQDLLRFLRLDGSKERPVALALHAWNVLEKDALPLILTYHTDEHESVVLDAIKLLVFLTLPPDDDATNKIDQKRKAREALEAMFRFRNARGDVFAVLFARLAGPLERYENSALRSRDDDGKLIQLFVTLIRNLLLAAEAPRETRGEANVIAGAKRLRAGLIKMLDELKVLDALAQMAKDARKKPFSEDSALLVETFHLLFASQSPSRLANALELREKKEAKGDADGPPEEDPEADFDGFDEPARVPKNRSPRANREGSANARRTFVDACRAKSTQMRHGRFGGATARLLARSVMETKKRKSLIGSELKTAPGGYFGERPTGGPSKRGAKGRRSDGAVMTSDTVGAFTADLVHDFGFPGGFAETAFGETNPPAESALASFAGSLAEGGFNEIILAAWNQLRRQEAHSSGTDEFNARVHSFLGLAHFFVVFSRMRLASRRGSGIGMAGAGNDAHPDASVVSRDVASASNLFDKHVFHWLRVTWDAFEEARDRKGLVLVSGVLNEMLRFVETIVDRASASDGFACEALVAETCGEDGGEDSLPRFFASRVRKYDTTAAPLVYLANVAEAMHASSDLAKRANPTAAARTKSIFDPRTAENHVRLAAHWRLNPPRLNAHLARFFAETAEAEMQFNLHSFAALSTLHAIATETSDETRSDLKLLRRVASDVVVDFVRGLYRAEREDGAAPQIPRQKYVDLVF